MAATVHVISRGSWGELLRRAVRSKALVEGLEIFVNRRILTRLVISDSVSLPALLRIARRNLVLESAKARARHWTVDVLGPVLVNYVGHWELRLAVLCVPEGTDR